MEEPLVKAIHCNRVRNNSGHEDCECTEIACRQGQGKCATEVDLYAIGSCNLNKTMLDGLSPLEKPL